MHLEVVKPFINLTENDDGPAKLTLRKEDFGALQEQTFDLNLTTQDTQQERILKLERRNDTLEHRLIDREAEIMGLKRGLEKEEMRSNAMQANFNKVASANDDLQNQVLNLRSQTAYFQTRLTESEAECRERAVERTLQRIKINSLQSEVHDLRRELEAQVASKEAAALQRTGTSSAMEREALISRLHADKVKQLEVQLKRVEEKARKDCEGVKRQYLDKVLELEDKLSESLRYGILNCPCCSAGHSYSSPIAPRALGDVASSYKAAYSAPEHTGDWLYGEETR